MVISINNALDFPNNGVKSRTAAYPYGRSRHNHQKADVLPEHVKAGTVAIKNSVTEQQTENIISFILSSSFPDFTLKTKPKTIAQDCAPLDKL